MRYQNFREELKDFYWTKVNDLARAFCKECTSVLDENLREGMSPYEMKLMQYRLISDRFEPVLFMNSPFYYETGAMSAHCDGAAEFRNGHKHPGGWTYWRNRHLFQTQDPELWKTMKNQTAELFYLICGPYRDTRQHFGFNYRPVFEHGLMGIYAKAQSELASAGTDEEKLFLSSLCEGLLCLKKMGGKFAAKALSMLPAAPNEAARRNLERIASTAGRVPWERPETFYEALNAYMFLRQAIGQLEGIGLNTFGRADMDLFPFYERDIKSGAMTHGEAYDLICRFLISYDLHYDHDMKMVAYADHELENTYVLGGCDADGRPFCNDLTLMFLRAAREEKIIFPKIKCRFSKNSPKEYLDEINRAVLDGTTTVLYQNDDACIPALVRAGRSVEEARDYLIAGCWDVAAGGVEKMDSGTYVNMLKPFEYSLHRLDGLMDKVGMRFSPIDGAESFEDVYRITCENISTLLQERARVVRLGGQIWNQVDPLMLFSSTLRDCIENHADYTAGGARYKDDKYMLFGFPDIVDSLLAIRELCFDGRVCSLDRLLTAVRNNWEGDEQLRLRAIRCHGWGDGSEESCSLAKRFYNDLYAMLRPLTGVWGGKVLMGFLTYTEIRWWGERTLAMPNGRRNGDYFAQGLTPSRLKRIPSITDVISSLACLDPSLMAGNSVVNVILPSDKLTPAQLEGFLRAAASSAVQSLQLNCTTKEQLLDAQKHPENHPNLIVRVTGFSAKFTSLSPEWQEEVLARNFYE